MPRAFLAAWVLLLPMLAETPAAAPIRATGPVLVIAHRGASALLPEHTLEAYAKAIVDGADVVEPDLVATRDGVLVARHENEIGGTTNVADHAEFADRRTRKRIDGREVEGWFTEDFTLAELKSLRARERLPELRGTARDDALGIPTLTEIIALVASESAARGRAIGLAPEIKHSSYFRRFGLRLEDALLADLAAHAHTRRAPVLIQSFEVGNLRRLRERLSKANANLQLVQLIGNAGERPADASRDDSAPSYGDMTTVEGLRRIAGYADAIGVQSRRLVPLDAEDALGTPTDLVRDAHAAGLRVFAYTFRPENVFLPRAFWLGDDPRARNEAGSIAEIRAHIDAGIDGFFTDDPAVGRSAVQRR